VQCNTFAGFIQIAYSLAAFGPLHRQGRRLQIVGAPGWVFTDYYQVAAKVPDRAASNRCTALETRERALLREITFAGADFTVL
jgi:hypothetical protein